MFDFGISTLLEFIGMYFGIFKTAREVRKMVGEILNEDERRTATTAHNAIPFSRNGHSRQNGKTAAGLEGIALEDESGPNESEELDLEGSTTKEARKKLIDSLKKDGYTEPMYYKKLATKVARKAKPGSQVSESDLLAKLNSEELPKSFQALDDCLREIAALDRESDDYRNPPQKPDTSKLNYLKDYRTIIAGYANYLSTKGKHSLKGRNRTHDVVLEEMVRVIESTHTHVITALNHSARITDGLIAYQEIVIEARIQGSAQEWSKAFNAARQATTTAKHVAQYKEGSTPAEYSQLSIAERNLARLIQHSTAKMGENEAIAVHNDRTLTAVNSLETNIRTGLLELDKFSTLIAQTVQDVQYTTHGTLLLKHGYKSVEAIAKSALTLRNVMSLRVTQINDAIGVFNEKLASAQSNISEEEETARGSNEQPRIMAVGYEAMREDALRMFARRGVAEAKKVLYTQANG